ncbi:MAG: hypothetical protein PVJ49_06070, partial [Acidobacteriota bacterium]
MGNVASLPLENDAVDGVATAPRHGASAARQRSADALAAARLPQGVTRGATALAPRPSSPAAVPLTPRWDLQEIAGRFTELSGMGGSACLTLATSMVIDAQRQAETAA